jgi:multimeric flavodoxin WrbA
MSSTSASEKNVMAFVGSPRRGGNTHILVDEILRGARDAGAAVQKIDLTQLEIHPCIACDVCKPSEICTFDDDFPPLWEQMRSADVWVLATPIYWGGPTAQFKAFVDRWRAPEEELKAMPDRHIILAMALGDDTEDQTRHLVGMMTEATDWIHKTINAVVVAPGVEDPGDIKKKPAILEQAYQVGQHAIVS